MLSCNRKLSNKRSGTGSHTTAIKDPSSSVLAWLLFSQQTPVTGRLPEPQPLCTHSRKEERGRGMKKKKKCSPRQSVPLKRVLFCFFKCVILSCLKHLLTAKESRNNVVDLVWLLIFFMAVIYSISTKSGSVSKEEAEDEKAASNLPQLVSRRHLTVSHRGGRHGGNGGFKGEGVQLK